MAEAKAKSAGKSLNDFRAAHDKNVIVPTKIRKAFSDMLAENPENWAYESDLMKRAGISQTDIGMFRDQFLDHVVETSGKSAKRVWFASAKVAAKVRELT